MPRTQNRAQRPQFLPVARRGAGDRGSRGLGGDDRDCLASMGIYLFNRDLLVDVLKSSDHEDFGKQIFPSLIEPKRVQVHLFDGYWEDIGTIQAFFNANLALADRNPPFKFGDHKWPIFTRARFLPSTRIDDCNVDVLPATLSCRAATSHPARNELALALDRTGTINTESWN